MADHGDDDTSGNEISDRMRCINLDTNNNSTKRGPEGNDSAANDRVANDSIDDILDRIGEGVATDDDYEKYRIWREKAKDGPQGKCGSQGRYTHEEVYEANMEWAAEWAAKHNSPMDKEIEKFFKSCELKKSSQ
jgi:hypothetical protein